MPEDHDILSEDSSGHGPILRVRFGGLRRKTGQVRLLGLGSLRRRSGRPAGWVEGVFEPQQVAWNKRTRPVFRQNEGRRIGYSDIAARSSYLQSARMYLPGVGSQ